MTSPVLLAPVSEDDPCGPDLRWDQEFMALSQQMTNLVKENATVEGEAVQDGDGASFSDVVDDAETLCGKTKDLRVLCIYVEARWRAQGFGAFAEALEDMVSVIDAWPDGATGVHPRADPDDGDLQERAAPLGGLINRIPALVASVGLGRQLSTADRFAAGATLRNVFEDWDSRLEPAFGPELPSGREAWEALKNLIGGQVAAPNGGGGGGATMEDMGLVAATTAPPADAWEVIESASRLMAEQDRHSPALPVLTMLSTWRSQDLIEIAEAMKRSGVSLEQLLDSIKKQTTS